MRFADRLHRQSLRARLSWSASAVVALWVLLLAVGANLLLGSALAGQADSVLQARAEAAATTLEVGGDDAVTVAEGGDDRALDVGTWILAGDGSIVEGPPGSSAALDRVAVRLAGSGQRTADVGEDEAVRLLALPVRDGRTQVATVVTSTSLAPYRQLARLALWGSAATALLLVVIVHLVLRANVGRALRPVQQMSQQAARWSAEDVDRRFGSARRPEELTELAATLDGVLDRLSAVLRHEKRLTDELSHELRTPLTRLRAEVDLARERPIGDPAVPAALTAIDAAAQDMQQIVETLLQAGRAGARTAPGRCRPAEAVATLLAQTGPTGPAGIDVAVDVDPSLVAGVDSAVLQRLLAPMLDNALRYARTQVQVRGSRTPAGVVLVVDDDGPGVAAADTDRVFVPGWRADPADGHPGGGLGLALARRLAMACGGTVTCRPQEGGRFEVTLPLG
ncbi:Signal transduction histidine kinase [Modestobacter sp. DSM 44400]|uniref:sensor histidine kinase n=1 Tax=Modestobacter sp. DSM 44400 TaxID=1550230 RepID=UPI000898F3BA|nr:HAMP domain-containing sensor histidine kinase [Modestobacter sp. DSM 44400]SDX60238.1 Signal transduction histidine kinase [Modestobacter sp. DSM 44400]